MEVREQLELMARRAVLVDDALELPLRPFRGLVRINPFGQSRKDLGGKAGSLARSGKGHGLSVSLAENGPGTDVLAGGSGTDTCVAGKTLSSCEL